MLKLLLRGKTMSKELTKIAEEIEKIKTEYDIKDNEHADHNNELIPNKSDHKQNVLGKKINVFIYLNK